MDAREELDKNGSRLRIMSGLTIWIITMGGLTGFLYGFNITLLSASMNLIGSELWPCDPEELELSSACISFIETNSFGFVETVPLERCINVGDCSSKDGNCIAPSPLDCSSAHVAEYVVQISYYLGGMLGGATGAFVTRLHSRLGVKIAACITLVGGLMTVFANSYELMVASRVITGVGIGISGVITGLVGGLAFGRARSIGLSCYNSAITVGVALPIWICTGVSLPEVPSMNAIMTSEGVANVLDYTVEVGRSDRIQSSVTYGLGCCIAFGLFCGMFLRDAETPGFLLLCGNENKAKSVINEITTGTDQDGNEAIASALSNFESVRNSPEVSWLKLLMGAGFAFMFWSGFLGSFVMQVSGINAIGTAIVNIFVGSGLAFKDAVFMSSMMMLFRIIVCVGGVIWDPVSRYGRRPSYLWMGVVQLIGIMLSAIGVWAGSPGEVQILGLFIYMAAFSAGFGNAMWTWVTEIWTPTTRDRGLSMAIVGNWLGSVICMMVVYGITDYNYFWLGLVIGNVVTVLVIYFMVYETKGLGISSISPYMKHIDNSQLHIDDSETNDDSVYETKGLSISSKSSYMKEKRSYSA